MANLDLKRLEKLLFRVNHSTVHLNSGGCGIFAGHLGKKLESLGYQVNIQIYGDFGRAHSKVQSFWNNYYRQTISMNTSIREVQDDCGADFGHVVVNVPKLRVLIDSTGIYTSIKRHKHDHFKCMNLNLEITPDEMIKLNSNRIGWNPMYNREQNPKLKRLIMNAKL